MNGLKEQLPPPATVTIPGPDNGAEAVAINIQKPVIGREEVFKAAQTLEKYREGKANLQSRVIENEEWYKLRHWECVRRDKKQLKSGETERIQPVSAWLFNTIANKHADAMDNFPSANILPREEGDKNEAKVLTSILPVILDQNDFEGTYSAVWDDKLKSGTGIYGVFWDKALHNGLGDITVKCIDVLTLYWEPGITDIQASRNMFHTELVANDELVAMYPEAAGSLGGGLISVAHYNYDDKVDTSDKSVVVDWYYKKITPSGKQVLHYCKFINDKVLFATENDPAYAERGWYDHGDYPFVFDPLYSTKGTPFGFGYIDLAKSAQEYIDKGKRAVLMNMLANAKPRWLTSNERSLNEEEFANLEKDFIHIEGSVDEAHIRPVPQSPFSSAYLDIINGMVDELKETTGNRDISSGGTTSGVTAASAIAAMQEAGSKLSRDANKASYRVYKKVCKLVIELIRQFYDMPRRFRIIGERGAMEYATYDNRNIVPQAQPSVMGVDMGFRIPEFDIEVTAQKQSPYTKVAQNELALQFYKMGFFNPQMADQALACLDMMDFDRKDTLIRMISKNGTIMQKLMQYMQLAYALAMVARPDVAQQIATDMSAMGMPAQPVAMGGAGTDVSVGGEFKPEEAHGTKEARQRVADSTAPR